MGTATVRTGRVSLKVDGGHRLSALGIGKSTLLNLIGLDRRRTGPAHLDQDLAQVSTGLACRQKNRRIIFQSFFSLDDDRRGSVALA